LFHCVTSLERLFSFLLRKFSGSWLIDTDQQQPSSSSSSSQSASAVFAWIKNAYTQFFHLVTRIGTTHEQPTLQIRCARCIFILLGEQDRYNTALSIEKRRKHIQHFCDRYFRHVLSSNACCLQLLQLLSTEYASKYFDIAERLLEVGSSLLQPKKITTTQGKRKRSRHSNTNSTPSTMPVYGTQFYHCLMSFCMHTVSELYFTKSSPKIAENLSRKKRQKISYSTKAPARPNNVPVDDGSKPWPRVVARLLSDSWLRLLRFPFTKAQYKQILRAMGEKILPVIRKPLLLHDFLSESYKVGGVVSMLSLNGLFVLITKHNLDYPHFYHQLYHLMDDYIFFVKYRQEFWQLTSTFLRSTHLSSQIIASFIKKLARLALKAPPDGCLVVMALIYNLLQKHPQCGVLINRSQLDVALRASSSHDNPLLLSTTTTTQQQEASDPYDETEQDPSKTHALDSSLWELKVLETHYFPAVAKFVGIFRKPYNPKAALLPLTDFSSQSYRYLIERSLKKKYKGGIPVEFENKLKFIDPHMKNEMVGLWFN